MFGGIYHGSAKHKPDLDSVLQRAKAVGVEKIIVTGTSLMDSAGALQLASKSGK